MQRQKLKISRLKGGRQRPKPISIACASIAIAVSIEPDGSQPLLTRNTNARIRDMKSPTIIKFLFIAAAASALLLAAIKPPSLWANASSAPSNAGRTEGQILLSPAFPVARAGEPKSARRSGAGCGACCDRRSCRGGHLGPAGTVFGRAAVGALHAAFDIPTMAGVIRTSASYRRKRPCDKNRTSL